MNIFYYYTTIMTSIQATKSLLKNIKFIQPNKTTQLLATSYITGWIGGWTIFGCYYGYQNTKHVFWVKPNMNSNEYLTEYIGKSLAVTGTGILGGMFGFMTLLCPQYVYIGYLFVNQK